MVRGETEQKLEDPKGKLKGSSNIVETGTSMEIMFSPRFKSAAAMAGWDEEALLIATLIVEDTPDRELKHKKRSDLQFKTPPTNSRRKRRIQRRSPASIPITILDLDEEETREESGKKRADPKISVNDPEKKIEETCQKKEMKIGGGDELSEKSSDVACSSSSIPCMDKLREELSCAICLEICFEPSTTPCGHSFCKNCLRSAADKCGKKCPKCRQIVGNGRSCKVNTVLWNTIQLLFPQEIEARKEAAGALNAREAEPQKVPERGSYNGAQNRRSFRTAAAAAAAAARVSSSSRDATVRSHRVEAERQSPEIGRNGDVRNQSFVPRWSRVSSSRDDAASSRRRRRGIPGQDEDAALALRLQREEFMEAFRGSNDEQQPSRTTSSLARENLRAMATRAMNLRLRGRPI